MNNYSLMALIAALMLSLYALSSSDRDTLVKVKSGELILTCNMYDGRRQIEPSKVEHFSEGRWYFTRGSAVSCDTAVRN